MTNGQRRRIEEQSSMVHFILSTKCTCFTENYTGLNIICTTVNQVLRMRVRVM